nr:hypothetical protein [Tanacetum cinerariifolium]
MWIEQYIQMIDYALWEVIENGATLQKIQVVEGVTTKVHITTIEEKTQRKLEVKARITLVMGISNEHQLKFNSIKDAKKLLKAVEKRFEMLDQTFDRLQKLVSQFEILEKKLSQADVNQKLLRSLSPEWNTHVAVKLTINGNETIGFDKFNVECYNCHKRGHVARECRALKNQDNKHKESSRRSVHVETSTFTALVSCDGLGGYDWREIAIRELRKKFEIAQKEKDNIQLNVDKFKHASKSLNKIIECQIVDNCNKGLGYEDYNAVSPPYTRNFMPPTPNLSFTSLDEFINKPVVENCKAKSSKEEPKVVRKNDNALIIKEWVLDNEEEDVSQPKIEKKTIKPSIVKIEFVKSKQQEKSARKTVKQVEQHRQNTHSPRGNQRN